MPPENIGVSCQKDPFDLELLRNMLLDEQDISIVQEEALERIPNIKNLAGPADTMSLEETEHKNLPVLSIVATVCRHLGRTE